MANRQFHDLQGNGTVHKIIAFAFAPQGASAPVLGEGCNTWVASITHSATGQFTITLADKYNALAASSVEIQMNAVTDVQPQWGAIDVVNAKTLVLNILQSATPTDIAANANNNVHIVLWLRNSTVTP
jgi:hypothetical protein